MTNAPLPDSSELTRENFIHSGWKEILGDSPMDHYQRAHHEFSTAISKAQEDGDLPRAKIFLLLAAACSMRLTNKSPSEPFAPLATGYGISTETLDSFSDPDINFLAEILDEVDHPMLKARLADIVWLKGTSRDVRFALEAIDNYRLLNLNKESWVTDIGDCWKRAIVLSLMLGGGAGNRVGEIEEKILSALDSATTDDQYFGHWLARILKEFRLGKDNEADIASKLKGLGDEFENGGNFYAARDYYRLAGVWFRDSGEATKHIDMQVEVAEGWVKETEQRMSSNNPSALVSMGFYDNAIQAYREVPNSERESRKINERITKLIQLHEDASQRALGEMKTVSTPGLDITKAVIQSRNSVKGKEPLQALANFISLHRANAQRIRQTSLENLKQSPFAALISHTVLGHDGRVAGKTQGVSLSGTPEENEPTVWAQMQQNYALEVDLVVRGGIMPALEVIRIEHQFREADFIDLTKNSPAVPPGREGLFGKALYYGYEDHFATAIHLLTPQVEHMIRYRLKTAGVNTLHIDQQGIPDEKGLSSLVEAPEFEEIFGEDLAFEIKSLFSDHLGPNLRNNVSHGLFTTEECQSIASIYAWWLALKIVFRTYWAAYQRTKTDQETTEGDTNNGNHGEPNPQE